MANTRLFEPVRVGDIELSSRVAMAPLTRFRADDEHVHLQPLVSHYYSQRSSFPGTLIIAEATPISPRGVGYFNTPGLWRDEQLASWKKTTDAIHAQGSFAYIQVWHMGRAAGAEPVAKHGVDVVGPSDIPMPDNGDANTPVKPRAMTDAEIRATIDDFALAAKRAVEEGGFDGVEIHAAHGYLVDQFLQPSSNQRTDQWGGSIENRSRFALEITRAVANAVGAKRTAIRLSPWSGYQGMNQEDNTAQFAHVVSELRHLGIAYLHLVEPRVNGSSDKATIPTHENNDFLFDIWGKTSPIVLAGGFKEENWRTYMQGKYQDRDFIIAYGRPFISTPDLVYRLQKGIAFTPYDRNFFYNAKSPKGYNDWAFSKEWLAEHPQWALTKA